MLNKYNQRQSTRNLIFACRKLSPVKFNYLLPIFVRLNHFQPQRQHSIEQLPCLLDTRDFSNHGFLLLSNHPNPEISCFPSKGFSQISTQTSGKVLHGFCVKGFVNLSVFYNNTLINFYLRFGRVGYARYVFDKMSERNEASWNNMMSGLVRLRLYWDATAFFREMWDFGIMPSGFAIVSLIAACDRSACMVNEGVQVHGFVVKYGCLNDVYVGTSLLNFYGSYGLAADATKVFEEMPDKNVVSWTSFMVNLLDDGDPAEVINIYRRMRYEGVSCNENTYSTVISVCGLLKDEGLGCQVLCHAIKSGLENSTSVGNSLVSMFSSFDNMEKASYVFEGITEHDTISWNSIISASVHCGLYEKSLRYFHRMRFVNVETNSTTLSTLISACGSSGNLKWGKGLHGLVVKFGLDSNVIVCNTLVSMYSESGRSDDAAFVFHEIPQRDLISWNSMMACFARDGRSLDALNLLVEMQSTKRGMSYVTFTSALSSCSNHEFHNEGKILHTFVTVTGHHKDVIVGNALVTMYAKSGFMPEAHKVFQRMMKRDEVTWNALIGGYAENENPNEVVKVFKLMRQENIGLSYITITNILGACLDPNDILKHGMPIHAHIILTGFESEPYVQNSLISMYAKCGDLKSSNYIFDGLLNKNSVAWNSIISATAYHGYAEETLNFVAMMRHAEVSLDQFTLCECLAATSKLAILEEGQQLHCLAIKIGFGSNPFVTNAAMDMYGKCGEMTDVRKIFPKTNDRSQLSWNIFISSLARHGCFQEAKEAFHQMLKIGVRPNHVSFVSLLSACSHGGLVEEGLAYYKMMTEEFGIPQGIEHCVCIVDLLGRAGKLDQAESFINDMPVPPSDLVWRSLLSACKIHRNLDLGKRVAERLFELDPSDDSAYVLYSNICSTTGRWKDAEIVRTRMGSNKIKKKPACSWVKLKNKVTSFAMGDKSHPQAIQIFAKLGELEKMVKEAGYAADTSFALQDTDEEQKEQNLWNHSERIALAFGLLNTPEGSPVKIFKNLRVCGDCHSVYKFVSEIINRRIILKDPYRFHHFSAGKCTCLDYW